MSAENTTQPQLEGDELGRRALVATWRAFEQALTAYAERPIEVRVEPAAVHCHHGPATAVVFVPIELAIDAVYSDPGDGHRFTKPVVAFDGHRPLVIGDRGLERADWASNFKGIVSADIERRTVVPAGDFRVRTRLVDGGVVDEPAAGFLVDDAGWGQTLVVDGDGTVSPVDDGVEVYSPSSTTPPNAEAEAA